MNRLEPGPLKVIIRKVGAKLYANLVSDLEKVYPASNQADIYRELNHKAIFTNGTYDRPNATIEGILFQLLIFLFFEFVITIFKHDVVQVMGYPGQYRVTEYAQGRMRPHYTRMEYDVFGCIFNVILLT